jgi:hypothetical protein
MALLKITREQILATMDIEAGVYTLRIRSIKAEEHKSKSGNATLKVTVVNEVTGPKDSEMMGRTITQSYYMNYLVGFLPLVSVVTGEKFDDVEEMEEELDLDTDSMVGKEYVARVTMKPYEGKNRPEISDVFPAGFEVGEMF